VKYPNFKDETDKSLHNLLSVCLDHTSFNLCLTDKANEKIKHDLENYINLFRRDKLLKNKKIYVSEPFLQIKYTYQK
jgi:hypothetical protein